MPNTEQPVALEDLLKLKRHETPPRDFWEDFEREFQQRRLRALMEVQERPGGVRLFRRTLLWSSPLLAGAAALAMVFGLPVSRTVSEPAAPALAERVSEVPPVSMSMVSAALSEPDFMVADFPASGQHRFVVDAFATEEEHRSFRRVLSSAALSVPASMSSRYVADPLTTGWLEARAGESRPRSHF